MRTTAALHCVCVLALCVLVASKVRYDQEYLDEVMQDVKAAKSAKKGTPSGKASAEQLSARLKEIEGERDAMKADMDKNKKTMGDVKDMLARIQGVANV